ncbi:FecR family protein [Polynucleobacter sinensis]|uniref:FecR family protein n=1 Tax=Polynucleobacter sinensis TaxID=1743157 RepID=UPI0007856577|nr:FecR family protein [Polynucleobacter sinensis]
MYMNRRAIRHLFIAIGLLAATNLAQAQGAEAGKVLMSLGDVKVTRGGKSIPLKKGDPVQSGDVIVTGPTSNAQVRMTDGAIMAIRSQSEFKINEYSFNGKADGSEKASLSLVKGGVRAVTGVIGRENKDNLKVEAVVATIGIRGTGFNIVYCQGNCSNADKTPAKDGLYAGVFEGKVTVANQTNNGTYGVNEPVLVESKTSSIQRLKEIPDFLRDPLAGQVIVPKKAQSVVSPVDQAVQVPKDSADTAAPATSALATVAGVVTNAPPAIAQGLSAYDGVYYNKPGLGSGTAIATSGTPPNVYLMQLAENFPGSVNPVDGLPFNNVSANNNNGTGTNANRVLTYPATWGVTTTGTGVTAYVTGMSLYTTDSSSTVQTVPKITPTAQTGTLVPDNYLIGTAQQLEGGNWNGGGTGATYVSWGRWAGGTAAQIGGYTNADGSTGIAYSSNGGFHYIIGVPTAQSELNTMLNTTKPILNFTLVGGTSPAFVQNPQGGWLVTSGNLTANFASQAISGNLAITTTQTAGYGLYNMSFSGALGNTPNNTVSASMIKSSGTLATCTAACAGTGNVSLYGANAGAAGLSYGINTGTNVLQGVAVFKR